MTESVELIAGVNIPWDLVTGYYLRVHSFRLLAEVVLDAVGPPVNGMYGVAAVEVPNPDVEPHQRIFSFPIEHKSDYKSFSRAQIDSGVQAGTNELIVVFENRRGLFGTRQASLHVAAYPTGTWERFFHAAEAYAADSFHWPPALFLYQPSQMQAFPCDRNLFLP